MVPERRPFKSPSLNSTSGTSNTSNTEISTSPGLGLGGSLEDQVFRASGRTYVFGEDAFCDSFGSNNPLSGGMGIDTISMKSSPVSPCTPRGDSHVGIVGSTLFSGALEKHDSTPPPPTPPCEEEVGSDDFLGDGLDRLTQNFICIPPVVASDPFPVAAGRFPCGGVLQQRGHGQDEGNVAKGHSGVVYCAQNRLDGRVYAVKRHHKGMISSVDDRESRLDEVHVMANLKHDHIVRYYETWFEPQGNMCIATEWCRLGDAMTFFLKPRDEAYFAVLLKQVSSALQAVHGLGWVHLDVKLENILLFQKRQKAWPAKNAFVEPVFKLCDFGTSRNTGTERGRDVDQVGDGRYVDPVLLNPPCAPVAMFAADTLSLGMSTYEWARGYRIDTCSASQERQYLRSGCPTLRNAIANTNKDLADLILSMIDQPNRRKSMSDVVVESAMIANALIDSYTILS
eukprot:TRINITY_DN21252_c0_g1_i1.p1 TRINITY_DN21252_c0_g1~~TRINITY_DN21252_c0_g1_i1.p1  ORF type:complete len:486 (+),score=126.15 TRINITY_DN21252_c0_g1_i1:94-1458(+)